MTLAIKRYGSITIKEERFLMSVRLTWYKFRELYLQDGKCNPYGNQKKKKATQNTQREMRKKFKHFTTKYQLKTNNTVMQEPRNQRVTKYTEKEQHNDRRSFLLITILNID